jgi:hypothetical protein
VEAIDRLKVELKAILLKWENAIETCEEQGKLIYKQMKEEHVLKQNEILKMPKALKCSHPSANTLALKQQEKQLAKIGKYTAIISYEEAHKAKMIYYESLKKDKAAYEKDSSKMMEVAMRALCEKQIKEEDSLISRLESKLRELEKMRDQEIEEINKRMKVVISDIESKHAKQSIQSGLSPCKIV